MIELQIKNQTELWIKKQKFCNLYVLITWCSSRYYFISCKYTKTTNVEI